MIEHEGFVLKHVGIDMEFYGPGGKGLKPVEGVEELYGREKEKATIFARSNGSYFSAEDLTKIFLVQTDAPLGNFVTEGAPGMGRQLARAVFPMEFAEGLLAVETEKGMADVKRLKIAIELEPGRTP